MAVFRIKEMAGFLWNGIRRGIVIIAVLCFVVMMLWAMKSAIGIDILSGFSIEDFFGVVISFFSDK